MKHSRLAFAALAVAGVIGALVLVRHWSNGPAYEGKSAAQWFRLYCTAPLAEQEDARDSFKMLGDRAVPYLLSVLTRSRRVSLVRLYDNVRSKLPSPVRRVLPGASAEDTGYRNALELLSAIRPSGGVLMPRLKPWLSNPEHPRYLLALRLLGSVGDRGSEGVPFLIEALESTNRYHRAFAVQSLANLGAEARAAVPALIGTLKDPATRRRAVKALGAIGPEAKEAVPHLERLLTTSNWYGAAAALHKINPEGNGLRLLIDAAADPQSPPLAIEHLGDLGPAALPVLDILLDALKTEDRRDRVGGPEWMSLANAMRKISPGNRAAVPILLDKLKDAAGPERESVVANAVQINASGYSLNSARSDRLNIAAELVRFDPAEPHGLEVLAETLRSDPEAGWRGFAAYVLRQAGPGARAAIPALRTALKDGDKTVRRAAASALRKIEIPDTK